MKKVQSVNIIHKTKIRLNSIYLMKYLPVYLICVTVLATELGCNQPPGTYLVKDIDSISRGLVPDEREGICDVRLYSSGKNMILRGETNLPEARQVFLDFLKTKNVWPVDSLVILPDTTIIKNCWGLIILSVSNIRMTPSHDAEMISQALMGTPVRILKEVPGWYLIQTPDSYIGWVDSEAIETLSTNDFNKWKTSPRIIYLGKTGDIYDSTSEGKIISDIVAGCIVEYYGVEKDHYLVKLPDGRKGSLRKIECSEFTEWAMNARPKPEHLISTAERFTGTPYLWGGTSSKGMDCSGFVKMVYYLNGIILARDVSLQFRYGLVIKALEKADNLKAGDLLFFGGSRNDKPVPSHVGMYIGDTEFIHSSGMVRINSLDSTRYNFSRYRKNSFIGARRITSDTFGKGIQLVSQHPWYK